MNRRRRNRLCIWLIILGLSNFLVYAIVYAIIGGDAPNGYIREGVYYVRGHFVHRSIGYEQDVSRAVWIYSYLHSISIWPASATVLLAMLVLARPHIIATYQRGLVKGTTLITVMATVIVLATSVIMILFSADLIRALYGT